MLELNKTPWSHLPVLMMKRLVFTIVVLLGCASVAMPQGVSVADLARHERERRKEMEAAREQLVKEVLQYSGGVVILDQLSRTFSDSSDSFFVQLPEDVQERLKKSTIESVSSSRLRPTFEKTFAMEMDGVTLAEVSRWYRTPIGARIFQVESHPTVPDPDFLKRPVSSDRARLVEQLDRQMQSSERTVAAIAIMGKAMLTKMLAISGQSQAQRDAFLREFDRGFMASAKAPLTAAIRNGILFTYRDVADSELDDYLHFLNTPAGQTFTRATWKALQAALQQGGADAGAAFGQVMKQMTAATTP